MDMNGYEHVLRSGKYSQTADKKMMQLVWLLKLAINALAKAQNGLLWSCATICDLVGPQEKNVKQKTYELSQCSHRLMAHITMPFMHRHATVSACDEERSIHRSPPTVEHYLQQRNLSLRSAGHFMTFHDMGVSINVINGGTLKSSKFWSGFP